MARPRNWSYSYGDEQSPYRAFSTSYADAIRFAMIVKERIVIDSAVQHGKPVICGTRLPVSVVVGSLAGGMTFGEIEREYDVIAGDICAALKFVTERAERRRRRFLAE
jgi:uncharacterized protein (DUF433 family)